MKAQRFGCIFTIGIVIALPLFAQMSTDELKSAARLNDQGKFREALHVIEPLLASSEGSRSVVMGVAWNIRGLSLENLGDWDGARRSYETAIGILRTTQAPVEQYASAIDNLGSVEADLGEFGESESLHLRAGQLYRSIEDHGGAARTSVSLALLALGRRDRKHTRQFLADARREEALASSQDLGEIAALDNVEAVEDVREGQLKKALDEIDQAIRLWTERNGPQYYLLATGLCLRGQIDEALHNSDGAQADLIRSLEIMRTNGAMGSRAYFSTERVYSGILRSRGDRDEADRLAADANRGFEELRENQCSGCSISAEGFR